MKLIEYILIASVLVNCQSLMIIQDHREIVEENKSLNKSLIKLEERLVRKINDLDLPLPITPEVPDILPVELNPKSISGKILYDSLRDLPPLNTYPRKGIKPMVMLNIYPANMRDNTFLLMNDGQIALYKSKERLYCGHCWKSYPAVFVRQNDNPENIKLEVLIDGRFDIINVERISSFVELSDIDVSMMEKK